MSYLMFLSLMIVPAKRALIRCTWLRPAPDTGPVDRGFPGRASALIESVGYGDGDRVVVGLRYGDAPPVYVSHGEPFTTACVASVSKQITAACVALLVRQGRLDIESALAEWIPELPAWAATVRVRHLIHHTGGLPRAVA